MIHANEEAVADYADDVKTDLVSQEFVLGQFGGQILLSPARVIARGPTIAVILTQAGLERCDGKIAKAPARLIGFPDRENLDDRLILMENGRIASPFAEIDWRTGLARLGDQDEIGRYLEIVHHCARAALLGKTLLLDGGGDPLGHASGPGDTAAD